MVTLQLRITGRVQGVGYRYALRQEAEKLGVRGWVRNRHDGSVEAVLQGEQSSLDAVVAWARRGPKGSAVADVTSTPLPTGYQEVHTRFEIRPSA
jgi:acylphosphatase